MPSSSVTYERLREQIASLRSASDQRNRTLVWTTADHEIALARDAEGRLEVFLPGGPLIAYVSVVAEVLEHQVWMADDDSHVAASRLVLPPGEHFDHIGALLCVELVAHGFRDDPQPAFSAVEPLIALALTRAMVTDLILIGLIGELALLERLLASAPANARADLLISWAGSRPSARDFQVGTVGVEVKTTQGAASIHHVEGVHQVELGSSNDGVTESALFMLSLGIGWITDPDQGRSLPETVDAILDLLPDPGSQADLLARIKQYGGDSAVGYDHLRDRSKPRYSTRFYFRFERLYDMSDDRLKLLTTPDLTKLSNIDPSSVSFRIVLADRVRGIHNRTNGWPALIAKIRQTAGMV